MAVITGLGTALPTNAISQEQSFEYARHYACTTARSERVLERLYKRTDIFKRWIAAPMSKYADVENFYPPMRSTTDTGPTTAKRMECYAEKVVPLALSAAEAALAESGVETKAISQLVTVTCTGFNAPGFDIALIQHLPLRADVGRTQIGFMGCHGSLNALRIAATLCVADDSLVLVCAAELCSIHFQYGWESNRLLANSLFSDGAAAVVLSGSGPKECWCITASGSFVVPDSLDAMTWKIGDSGFEMTLSAKVPDIIRQHLRDWIAHWLHRQQLNLEDIQSWAVHPGGPRILDAVQESLNLNDDALNPSRSTLADCGNMSSPTLLFILQKLQQEHAPSPCVMLGFGPGLTIEAALLL